MSWMYLLRMKKRRSYLERQAAQLYQEALKDMTARILEIGIIERRVMLKRRLGRGRRGENEASKRAVSWQERYSILYFNKI